MRIVVGALPFILATAPLGAQQQARIETVAVAPGVHMLTGPAGNVGVFHGSDGVFLVDDQYAPLTGRIMEAVRAFSDEPIRFVVNTHWHGDHTGGNENLGAAGALIVAHDHVRERMSVDQFIEALDYRQAASPPGALPVITFSEAVTFFLNGDKLHVAHAPRAHTDGDAIVHFRGANVIHMGDTFFNKLYPFIDVESGGGVDGVIAAADLVLEMARADTKIIPGHGPLASRDDLVRYRDMLVTVRAGVRRAMEAGRTLEEIQQAGITSAWDAEWGGGFTNPARFVSFVYHSLSIIEH